MKDDLFFIEMEKNVGGTTLQDKNRKPVCDMSCGKNYWTLKWRLRKQSDRGVWNLRGSQGWNRDLEIVLLQLISKYLTQNKISKTSKESI